MRMALTFALLPAIGARPVHLQAVGADLEAANVGKTSQIQRALLELRDPPESLTDEVVVMVKIHFIYKIAGCWLRSTLACNRGGATL
jgi:hypothetical protein